MNQSMNKVNSYNYRMSALKGASLLKVSITWKRNFNLPRLHKHAHKVLHQVTILQLLVSNVNNIENTTVANLHKFVNNVPT